MRSGKPVTILLVEDDEVDVKALRWAFDKLKIANPVAVARDGVEALELLKTLSRPFLIITDINMPRMNGIEFLRNVRASKDHRDSIVFVLTTSNDEQDKIDAYNLNVAGLGAGSLLRAGRQHARRDGAGLRLDLDRRTPESIRLGLALADQPPDDEGGPDDDRRNSHAALGL